MSSAIATPPASDFVPVYAQSEMRRLLKYWLEGSLDGISSPNKVVSGVQDCDVSSWGLRVQPLLTRYTIADVSRAVEAVIASGEHGQTLALVLLLEFRYTLDTLARALGLRDCYQAQSLLCNAYDAFAKALLG